MPGYRANWQKQYGTSGGRWEDVSPYYQYGYEARSNPSYQGQTWATVEPRLRQDWETRYPTTPWAKVRQYVSDVWSGTRGT